MIQTTLFSLQTQVYPESDAVYTPDEGAAPDPRNRAPRAAEPTVALARVVRLAPLTLAGGRVAGGEQGTMSKKRPSVRPPIRPPVTHRAPFPTLSRPFPGPFPVLSQRFPGAFPSLSRSFPGPFPANSFVFWAIFFTFPRFCLTFPEICFTFPTFVSLSRSICLTFPYIFFHLSHLLWAVEQTFSLVKLLILCVAGYRQQGEKWLRP
jgi:hypothetical protein